MPNLTAEKHLIVGHVDHLPSVGLLEESFAAEHGIPSVLVHQVRLILVELLQNMLEHGFDADMTIKINIRLKLYEHGRFSIKISHRGLAFNPFECHRLGPERFENDQPINTLGLHLARKYMDQCTYWRALDHNIVFMSKERV